MKPFALEAAKRGEPIVCRDGTPAKFIAYVPEARPAYRVVVLVDDLVAAKCADGRHWPDSDSNNDIFMAPKKRTVWVVLYPGCGPRGAALYFNTQEEAEAQVVLSRVIGGKVWPLEIEE